MPVSPLSHLSSSLSSPARLERAHEQRQPTPVPAVSARALDDATLGLAQPVPAHLGALRPPAIVVSRTAPRNANDVCPITQVSVGELARPFHAPDGYIYDRAALRQWCLTSNLSPMTREPMPGTSRTLLGYTGRMQRQARKAGEFLVSPPGAFSIIVAGGLVVGGVVGPLGLLLFNRSHDYQISPLVVALSAPLGGAVFGFAAYATGLPLCRAMERRQMRAQHIAMQPVSA